MVIKTATKLRMKLLFWLLVLDDFVFAIIYLSTLESLLCFEISSITQWLQSWFWQRERNHLINKNDKLEKRGSKQLTLYSRSFVVLENKTLCKFWLPASHLYWLAKRKYTFEIYTYGELNQICFYCFSARLYGTMILTITWNDNNKTHPINTDTLSEGLLFKMNRFSFKHNIITNVVKVKTHSNCSPYKLFHRL